MMKELSFKNCYLIEFSKHGDNSRGYLTAIEKNNGLPFDINRIYYIYEIGNLNEIRGPHAHKKTEQIFITLKG
ncbi:MAG: WxcM-like domain-containing protein, partial [Promethearchaeota archaeon]